MWAKSMYDHVTMLLQIPVVIALKQRNIACLSCSLFLLQENDKTIL